MPNTQDTPPRGFRELAEVSAQVRVCLTRQPLDVFAGLQGLITSHFMGQCHWSKELVPQGTRSSTSRVGRINAVDPVNGVTMPFFVFVQDNQWRCSMWSPVDTGWCFMHLSIVTTQAACC